MRQRVSLAQFCCLQRAPPAGWKPEEQVTIQKQKQRDVHAAQVPRVRQPEEGQGGGITVGGIVIQTPVQCHPPVLLPALHQLHVQHRERGKFRMFTSPSSLNLRH